MSDNTPITPGSGDLVVRSKDKGGIQTQVVLLDLGGAGAETLLTQGQALMAASLPVTLASDQTVPVTGSIILSPTSTYSSAQNLGTAAYVPGDIVGNRLSGGTLNFTMVGRSGSCTIEAVQLMANPHIVGSVRFRVHFYRQMPYTLPGDHALFMDDKYDLIREGIWEMPAFTTAPSLGAAGSATDVSYAYDNSQHRPVIFDSGMLYVILETLDAWTPDAAQWIYMRLWYS